MPILSIHQTPFQPTRSTVLPLVIDITEQELRQLAEDSWANQDPNQEPTAAPAGEIRYSYYRFVLRTPRLLLSTRKLLARCGVDWLEEGGPYEAYGIIPEGAISQEVFCALENVLGAEPGEPPCSK